MPELRDGYGYEDFDSIPDEDTLIEEALGENPRAYELHQMIAALEGRREMFTREYQHTKDARERAALNHKLDELAEQIDVLKREEAITTFVEGSVRVTLYKPSEDDY